MAVALAGCGGTAPAAPANTLALAPSPGSSAAPTQSPGPTASPTPDQAAQAAQAYLALATRLNAATAALGSLSSAPSLAQVKSFYASLVEIQAGGVADLQAISFPTRLRDDVENLIRATNAVRTIEAGIAAAASMAEVSARTSSLGPANDQMAEAANNLRQHLGLPPAPTPAPTPTPRPTATPSPASSIDPTANLRIAPPYTLEPLDAATAAQIQTQLKLSLGSLTSSFRLGERWAMQGTEQVALVMVLEVPGAGAAVTSPAFLDQVAASMAGVSAADVQTATILGQPVRLVEKFGVPIAVYVEGEGIAIVLGVAGMSSDSLQTIVTALLKARV